MSFHLHQLQTHRALAPSGMQTQTSTEPGYLFATPTPFQLATRPSGWPSNSIGLSRRDDAFQDGSGGGESQKDRLLSGQRGD